jgi:hypothetical protein
MIMRKNYFKFRHLNDTLLTELLNHLVLQNGIGFLAWTCRKSNTVVMQLHRGPGGKVARIARADRLRLDVVPFPPPEPDHGLRAAYWSPNHVREKHRCQTYGAIWLSSNGRHVHL